jgi:hypothetical protein
VKKKWRIGLGDWRFWEWAIWGVRVILLNKRSFMKEEEADEKSGSINGDVSNGNFYF